MYEAVTTSPDQRVECVRKLLSVRRSVSTIGPVGKLVRYEIEQGKPYGRLLKHCHDDGIGDLQKLADPEHILAADESVAVDSEKVLREKDTLQEFMRSAAELCELRPEVATLQGLQAYELLPRVSHYVQDSELLDSLYRHVRAHYVSLPESIAPEWALFRRIQAHLLMTTEFVRRHGVRPVEPVSKRLTNLYLDVDYLVLGVLAGALATRDELLEDMLRMIAPSAEVVN